MYGLSGGCSSILHLTYQYPILLVAYGILGFAAIPGTPGVGDRLGTRGILTAAQNKVVRANPALAANTVALRADFDQLRERPEPTEDEIKAVLKITDACTDVSVQDVMKDSELRKQVAWIMYLDTYSRGDPKKSLELYKPPRK